MFCAARDKDQDKKMSKNDFEFLALEHIFGLYVAPENIFHQNVALEDI